MKKTFLRTVLILAAIGYMGCSLSPESRFFSDFSMRKLVEQNKSHSGLVCDAGGGGGGGEGGMKVWSVGRKEFHSHKGDSFDCWVKPDAVNHVDELALIAALRQDVDKAIIDSRATIIETGNPTSSSFYFRYTFAQAEGRVEISARRVRDNYYSFNADLDEGSKGRTK